MFRVATEKDLLDAFRPRDRAHLELPKGLHFPLIVRDYLAWPDQSGARIFLFFQAPGYPKPTGIAFRRDVSRTPDGAHLCEWCHAYGSSEQIGLLSADVSSRKRVGVSLCLDLGCGPRIEDAADRAGKNPRVQARALVERMARFSREALGIHPYSRD